MKHFSFAIFCLSASVAVAQHPIKVYDVTHYGARGDGLTFDSVAINAAIDAAAQAGGGTVHFPAGNYLSYTIRLKSHVTLYLDSGSTIIAAEPPADLSTGYDQAEPNSTPEYQDFGHSHWHNSLIWGEDLENISIIGPGTIFGRGLSNGYANRRDLLPNERSLANPPDVSLPTAFVAENSSRPHGPFGYPGPDSLPNRVGNKAIALKHCRNVILRDFTIYHGGHFGILGTGVSNWTLDNLKIDTDRDGIDVDGCLNVRISNCTVNSPYDDGICLKSSFGLGRLLPTENITISNCQVSGYDEGTLLDGTRQRTATKKGGVVGRIKLGTESNGAFRNITIANCVFEYCRGLALESVDGALMEDIAITNVTMRDIVNAPIFIRLGSRLRGPRGTVAGTVRRIKIDTLVAHNVTANGSILISGVPGHVIEDLALSNILIDYVGGGTKEQRARTIPELEQDYPEPNMFGILPAWGLFARHAKNLWLDRIELRTRQNDLRSALYLAQIDGAVLDRTSITASPGTVPLIQTEIRGLVIRNSDPSLEIASAEVSQKHQP